MYVCVAIDGVRESREFTYIVVRGGGDGNDGKGKCDVNVTVLQLLVRSFAANFLSSLSLFLGLLLHFHLAVL